jgi:trehalose/maltose hydrolase-like predicted phosphorylase
LINADYFYIGGVFNGPAVAELNTSHRAKVPAHVNIRVKNESSIAAAIDIERGIYFRRSNIGNASVEQRWYAHRRHKNLIVHEIELLSPTPSLVCLEQSTVASPDFDFHNVETSTPTETRAISGSIKVPELSTSNRVSVTVIYPTLFNDTSLCLTLLPKQVLSYKVVVVSDLEPGSDIETANKLWHALDKQQNLIDQHVQEWNRVWTSGVEVKGDMYLARSLNSSLYYLISSIRDDWDYSLSPGSLASNSYNGHTFWDYEIWMYPVLLAFHPNLALSGLRYRFNRLEGARAKAASYKPPYNGAMFPCESAYTGEEVCPTFATSGQLEQHTSGDLVFAVKQYYYKEAMSAQDQQKMWELVSGVCEFLDSRVTKRDDGKWGIKGVMPPDEYAGIVDNCVYTNVIAGQALEFAAELAKELNYTIPARWMDIAQNIYIPMNGSMHLEFEGYQGKTIKQADVVLLGYPFNWNKLTRESRLADLNFYKEVTDPVSVAMTWGMYSISLLELNGKETDESSDFFNRSYKLYVKDPYFVWTETPTAGAVNFITGAGAFLQAYVNGYGGLRIEKDKLLFNPIMKTGVSYTKLRGLKYRNNVFNIEYDENDVIITLLAGDGLTIENNGKKMQAKVESPVAFTKSAFTIALK